MPTLTMRARPWPDHLPANRLISCACVGPLGVGVGATDVDGGDDADGKSALSLTAAEMGAEPFPLTVAEHAAMRNNATSAVATRAGYGLLMVVMLTELGSNGHFARKRPQETCKQCH
jgi:hypothetical protein